MNESLKKSVGEKASILLSEENRQKFFNTSEKDIIRRTLAKNLTDSACVSRFCLCFGQYKYCFFLILNYLCWAQTI